MTKVDLRLKYKQETGESPTVQRNINYIHNGEKIKHAQWLTNEYSEWLEEEILKLHKNAL